MESERAWAVRAVKERVCEVDARVASLSYIFPPLLTRFIQTQFWEEGEEASKVKISLSLSLSRSFFVLV